MPPAEKKEHLTTGEVAKYCGVNFRTVIRWIEKGILKSYKLPGRGDNRVPIESFTAFLKSNNMPIPEEFAQQNDRVLIIEDEPSMAASIKRVLVRSGYEVEWVTNGIEAGAALESFKPSLITLDLQMPKMDGFEMLQFLNKNKQYQGIKVLVISGVGDEGLEKAVKMGAHKALSKPFNNEMLIRYVSELLV